MASLMLKHVTPNKKTHTGYMKSSSTKQVPEFVLKKKILVAM